jgi:hypothetical protein
MTSTHQSLELATVRPTGPEKSFTAQVGIPMTAADGHATITDGLGHEISLDIQP